MSRFTLLSGAVGAGLLALAGALFIAAAVIGTDDPRDWLEDNATPTSATSWSSPEPPLRIADRIAAAVRPQSRLVSTWGVALRYGRGTLTVTAGPADGTSAIYWESASDTRHRPYRWRIGRWDRTGGAFDPIEDEAGTTGSRPRSTTAPSSAELVQTRRGEDFRGGGPGGGK